MVDFLKLVAKIEADASELIAALGKAGDKVEDFAKDAKKEFASVAKSLDDAGRSAKDIGLKMGAMGAAIAGPLALAAGEAGKFSKGMANVAALGVKDLDKMADGVQDIREEFGLLEDGTEAAYNAISAGVSESAALGVLEKAAIGARAGVGTLNEALDLGTGIVNSYGWEANSAADEVRNMERAMAIANTAVLYGKTTIAELSTAMGRGMSNFANAGVEMEEFAAHVAALTTNNVSASEAVTQLNASLNSIYNQSEDAKKIIAELNLEFNETTLKAKGYSQFWSDVVEKIRNGNPALYEKKLALEQEVMETEKSIAAMEEQVSLLQEQKRQMSAAKMPTEDLANQIAALKKRLDESKDSLSKSKNELKDLAPIQEDANATLVRLVGSQEAFRGIVAVTGPLLDKVREAMTGMKDGVENLNKSFEASKAADQTFAYDQMAASLKTLSEDVGAAVLESFAPMAEKLTEIVQKTREWAEANPQIAASLATVTGGASGLLVILGGIGFALGGIAQGVAALLKLGALIGGVIVLFAKLQVAVTLVGWAVAALAVTFPAMFAAVAAGLAFLLYNWRATFAAIWGVIAFFYDIAVGLFAALVDTIGMIWKTMVATVATVWDLITLDFEGVMERWTDLVTEWAKMFMGWLGKIGEKIASVWNKAGDLTGGTVFKVYDYFFGEEVDTSPNPKPPAPNIPKMAMGGIVTRPTFAMIGEAGPEAVIPLDKLGSVTNNSGGNAIHINVYGGDANETAERVFDILNRRMATS